MSIKHLLKSLTSPQQRVAFKRWKRHIKAFFKGGKKTTLEDLKDVLIGDLGIKAGDRIVVASSFGNLNADYSPKDVVELLMKIVTKEGGIMMPYYPPTNSTIWAKEGSVFDMEETKSGMGVITNVFSKMPGVVKSIHPTKAVCVWGKDAEQIAKGHEVSTTPYYWDSPYGKYLKLGSKSLGLGLEKIPMEHAMEDILSDPCFFYYQQEKYNLKLVKKNGTIIEVNTYIHDDVILDKCMSPGDYTASLKAKSYKKENFGLAFLYVIDNSDLFEEMKKAFAQGYTRYTANKNTH